MMQSPMTWLVVAAIALFGWLEFGWFGTDCDQENGPPPIVAPVGD